MFYVVIDVWDEVKNDKVRAKTYLFLFGLTGSNFEQLWLDMYIIINVHVYTHTHTHTYIYIYIYIFCTESYFVHYVLHVTNTAGMCKLHLQKFCA